MQQPLYQIKNLTAHVKKELVLTISNLEIHRGIAYAIVGKPGAGKTSLLEILARQQAPSGGTILYDGEPVAGGEANRTFDEEVYYLPQAPSKGWAARGKVEDYMLRGIRTASWSSDSASDRLQEAGRRMGLSKLFGRKVKTLSPGERRWVDLAVCLASDAKVLIVDALELHLSPDELDLVKRQIQRKCSSEGTTAMLSTLNPNTLRRMTGISVTLDRGRIAMIRSVREGGRGRRSPRKEGNGGRASKGGDGRASRAGPQRRR
ncbi:MAG: ABC transporter ATP-binding protein [Candidatus Neomarinimicrobiota bacterium]